MKQSPRGSVPIIGMNTYSLSILHKCAYASLCLLWREAGGTKKEKKGQSPGMQLKSNFY